MLIGKRRGLLEYLKSKDAGRYRTVIDKLGIRR
jgi:small subunit ribosomal protein S15